MPRERCKSSSQLCSADWDDDGTDGGTDTTDVNNDDDVNKGNKVAKDHSKPGLRQGETLTRFPQPLIAKKLPAKIAFFKLKN